MSVAAFADAQRRGAAVVNLGSKMVDPPVVHRALELVERARAMWLGADAPQEESR